MPLIALLICRMVKYIYVIKFDLVTGLNSRSHPLEPLPPKILQEFLPTETIPNRVSQCRIYSKILSKSSELEV